MMDCTPKRVPHSGRTRETAEVSPRQPNWYAAMVEFKWTVRNIMVKFDVPRAVAADIQHTFPTFEDACRIARTHKELCAQVGH